MYQMNSAGPQTDDEQGHQGEKGFEGKSEHHTPLFLAHRSEDHRKRVYGRMEKEKKIVADRGTGHIATSRL